MSTIENIAAAQLDIDRIFFAMRSYECLRSNNPDTQTKTLGLRNLRFYKKGNNINLALSDTVIIIFESQKSGERHESVTVHRSGDTVLCPTPIFLALLSADALYVFVPM